MKQAFTTVAFALGASAATLRRSDDCCFQLTASGGVSGVLGQLGDGQNRVGGSLPAGTYCINSSGGITDSNGRGCILTPPTTQFQCDTGATPTTGFTVSSSGELDYNGSDQFYACPATDSEYNIYTTPVANQPKCEKITLNTGGKCSSSQQSASSSAIAASTSPVSGAPVQSSSQESASSSAIVAYSTPVASVSAPSSAQQSASSSAIVPSTTAIVSATAQSSATPSNVETCSPVTQYITVTATDCSACSATGVAPIVSSPSPVASTSAVESSASVPVVASSPSAESTPVIAPTVSQPQAPSSAPVYSAPTEMSSASVVSYSTATVYSNTETTMVTQGSSASAQSPISTAPAVSYAPSSASAASASACQTSLTGAYQTPHLIVPVCSTSPDTAYGTSYNGQVNSTTSSIFNFDIPESYEGMTCSIIFMFPEKSQLETSDYTCNEVGNLVFSELSSAASQSTTWNTCPTVKTQLNSIAIQEGNTYVVSTGSCQAGKVESIELSSANGMAMNFFEDTNPASLGLYITAC